MYIIKIHHICNMKHRVFMAIHDYTIRLRNVWDLRLWEKNKLLDGHKRMNLQTIDGIANSFSVITSTFNKMFRIKTNGYDMIWSGQISIIPKPELRGFWGSSLIKPPFRVTSADVVIICPDMMWCDMIWYDTIWYDMIWVRYSEVDL